MASEGFQFKQFYIRHDKCAMKVGTDGVLLGAWAPAVLPSGHVPISILDIGTGSGLVALMLAQRLASNAPNDQMTNDQMVNDQMLNDQMVNVIDAIDIAPAAVKQAKENFSASPWSDRLHAHLSRLQDWQMPMVNGKYPNGKLYHLVVSNPPYFHNSLKNPDKARQTARHTDTLSFSDLFRHSARLLSENGVLALILPAETEQEVRSLAAAERFIPTHITRVYSKDSKPARRVLLAFGKSTFRDTGISSQNTLSVEDALVLENETGGRSAAYQELTKDFYL